MFKQLIKQTILFFVIISTTNASCQCCTSNPITSCPYSLTISSNSRLLYADFITLSKILVPNTPPKPIANSRDKTTLAIKMNKKTLVNLSIFGRFEILWGGGVIDASETVYVDIRYLGPVSTNGELTGVESGRLIISGGGANDTILLSGLWSKFPERSPGFGPYSEPCLFQMAKSLGISSKIGTTESCWYDKPNDIHEPFNNYGGRVTSGDELLGDFMTVLDPSREVGIRQVACYKHVNNVTATTKWFYQGNPNSKFLFTINPLESQTILPYSTNGSPAYATFNPLPAQPFGFALGKFNSDSSLMLRDPKCTSGFCGRYFRYWPVKNLEGGVMKGLVLMAMDYAGGNFDYNDNVWILSNVQVTLFE